MKIYSAVIIAIGLSLILINNHILYAIAKEAPDNLVNHCHQIDNSVSKSGSVQTISIDNIIGSPNLVTSTKAAPDITQYSFWWAALQFDPFDGKLIQDWLAYPQKQQINLIVNWQLWNLLDYFGRYRFVNQFGTVARKYGYSLNIFNQKDQCLASYRYNPTSIPPKWELNLEESGKGSLPIEPGIQQQPLIDELP